MYRVTPSMPRCRCDAGAGRAQSLCKYERQDRGPIRAKRAADAELTRPLRDAGSQHAVNANGRQHQRHHAEQRQEHRRRAPAAERSRQPLFHCANFGDRLFRIDCADRSGNLRGERRRFDG